jgi:hypothetical protein
MTATSETLRFVRHAVTPLAIVAVHQGWLPEAAQADVIEVGVIAVSFAVAMLMSWREDRAKGNA